MARGRRRTPAAAGIEQVQKQARALLQSLLKEIRDREQELSRMKRDASNLSALTGARKQISARGPVKAGSGRINWRQVLEQLPKQFKASNVRAIRGLKNKRPSEVFAAITRWMESGMVKRRQRGVYERV
jgi:hypothetical protein